MCNLVFVLFFFYCFFHFHSFISSFWSHLPVCLSIFLSIYLFIYLSGNHSQISRAIVAIRVMDINDNAPEFATEYETFLCENGKPGQVRKEVAHSSNQSSIFHSLCFSPSFSFSSLPCNDWPQWIIAYLFHWETIEVGVWAQSFFFFFSLPSCNSPPLTPCAQSEGEMRAVRIDQSGS